MNIEAVTENLDAPVTDTPASESADKQETKIAQESQVVEEPQVVAEPQVPQVQIADVQVADFQLAQVQVAGVQIAEVAQVAGVQIAQVQVAEVQVAETPVTSPVAPAKAKPAIVAKAKKDDAKKDAGKKQTGSKSGDKFSDFELAPEVLAAVEQEGYTTPTEIQARAIPVILGGSDVIGQANTGTGKTAAFALPLLSRIDPKVRATQVVVLAPTRELAIQVSEAFDTYAKNLPDISIATIYGGQSYGIQISQLRRGAHIVVGTPGRVIDHMKRGNLKLNQLKSFVLDEADEMLNMGFAEDVQWILSEAPEEDRQTLLFSATMPPKLRRIAEQHLTDPQDISAMTKTLTVSTVHQRAVLVKSHEKLRLLARVLESEETDAVIIFVKTKDMSTRLAENLCQRGFQASALNGDMAQNQRERTVERLKAGRLNILVATDVAARGLDVERITHVINYDHPGETEAYVHRIGRTGRAGRQGHAILFVGPRERNQTKHLEKATGQKITWMLQPTNEEIAARRGSKLLKQLTKELKKEPSDDAMAVVQSYLAENPEASAETLAACLAQMFMQRRDSEAADHLGGKFDSRKGKGGRDRRDGGNGRDRRDFRSKSDRGGDRNGGRGKYGDRDRRDSRGGGRRDRRDSGSRDTEPMVKYRIEVGYAHDVKPGNIVGALTSDGELRGSDIGGIDINTNFTTVDLPARLSEDQIRELGNLKVAGQPLKIRKWVVRGGNNKFDEKPRKFNRKKGGKPAWKKQRKKPAAK